MDSQASQGTDEDSTLHRCKKRKVGISIADLLNAEPLPAEVADSCAVCEKLFEVLTARYGYVGFEKRVELGLVSDVVHNSQCRIHPQAFRMLFGEHLLTIRSGPVTIWKRERSLVIEGSLHNSDGTPTMYLAGSEQIAQKLNCQTHLDPAWIDEGLLTKWKTACDTLHHAHADRASYTWPIRTGPRYLVDAINECLVEVETQSSYVALSYVWGQGVFFHTTKHILADLLQPHAFAIDINSHVLPQTIRHAFEVVKLVGERFLWVDALCIPQDDEVLKHNEIRSMAAIYANASFTIIAGQGLDANAGLRGLRGTSQPRNFIPNSVPFLFGSRIIQYNDPSVYPENSLWAKRGWTFQERVLSRRMLVFNEDTVYWQCPDTIWTEVDDHGFSQPSRLLGEVYSWQNLMSLQTSDLYDMESIILEYNTRTFTYPEDASDAFTGMSSMLTATHFPDGFLWGIPIIFFDMFLLWQPQTTLERRRPKNATRAQAQTPSWSWLAWHGSLAKIMSGKTAGGRLEEWRGDPSNETIIPICEWRTHETPYSDGVQLPSSWHVYRTRYLKGDECPPPGWTRHESDWESRARGFQWDYTHHKTPHMKCRYPLPKADDGITIQEPISARFLSCRAQRVILYLAEVEMASPLDWYRVLRDGERRWAGMIKMHSKSYYDEPDPGNDWHNRVDAQAMDGEEMTVKNFKLGKQDTADTLAENEHSNDNALCDHSDAISELADGTIDGVGTHESQAIIPDEVGDNIKTVDERRSASKGHGDTAVTALPTLQTVELVAISEGSASEAYGAGEIGYFPPLEMKHRERPRNTDRYEFYNVLCIRRDGDVAYREGVGRVLKAGWDRQGAKEIDLMLG